MNNAESDFASAVAPIGNIVGWCLFFSVTTLPLSGVALGLYTSPQWSANDLSIAWILSFVLPSLFVYGVVERARRTPLRARVIRGAVLAALLAFIGSIPPSILFGAYDRGKQKRAVVELRGIAQVIHRHVVSPAAQDGPGDGDTLNTLADPRVPPLDPWGCPYRIAYRDDDWFLFSTGSDCTADVEDPREYREGAEQLFEADIVIKNGRFLKWPEGMQE